MKLSGLQVVQLLAMIVAPFVIGSNVQGGSSQWKETTTIWSCVVIAFLFVGISICSVANAIGERNKAPRQF